MAALFRILMSKFIRKDNEFKNSPPATVESTSSSEMTSNPRTCTTPLLSSVTPRISEQPLPATPETDAIISSPLMTDPRTCTTPTLSSLVPRIREHSPLSTHETDDVLYSSLMTSDPRTCTTPILSSLSPRISEHSPPATPETDTTLSSSLINGPTSGFSSLIISNSNVSPTASPQMNRTGTYSLRIGQTTPVNNRESISPIPVRQRQFAIKSTSRPPEFWRRLRRILDQQIQGLHDPVNHTRSMFENQEEFSMTARTERLGTPIFRLPDTFRIDPFPRVESANNIPTTNIPPVVPRKKTTTAPASKKKVTSSVRIKETARKSTSRPPNFFGSSLQTSDAFQRAAATVIKQRNATTAPKKKAAAPESKKKVAATVTTKEIARKSTSRLSDTTSSSRHTYFRRSVTSRKETARKSTALPPRGRRNCRMPHSSPLICSSGSEYESDEDKKNKNGSKRQKHT